MKVILDTNVLMSAIFWGRGPRKILDHWIDDQFRLVASKDIAIEYEEVFDRLSKKYKTADPSILNSLLANLWMVEAGKLPTQVCKDPDDDKFLACALASKAKYIITGDKLLLQVGRFAETDIVVVSKFLSTLT